MSDPDLLVLRRGTHGRSTDSYAEHLRERLPDYDVRLARTPAQERRLIAGATAVTGTHLSEELLAEAGAIELFACLYAGVGHLSLPAFEERDIAVTNAAGVHAPNVAEYVVGAVLAFARGLHVGWERSRRGEWRHYRTRELQGSTVTVVGLGNIGRGVVDRLAGFGVETVGVRHTPAKGGPTDELLGFDDDLHDAYARTDYLVLACPLTETTRGLIDRDVFETLPPEAVLVNVARGAVVDTDALVAAIRRNRVRGAALDVTDPEPLPGDHPLWSFGNVLVTPHNAGDTPAYYDRAAEIVAGNVRAVVEGSADDLRNRVV
ncbi:MAG: D-2-hydroxyacid dehydrogenase [Salinirussus sp.]